MQLSSQDRTAYDDMYSAGMLYVWDIWGLCGEWGAKAEFVMVSEPH